MTLVLTLPERQEAALKAKAQTRGVSAEEYASQVLAHDLEKDTPPIELWPGLTILGAASEEQRDSRPIWDVIADRMKDVPTEDFAQLPKDGADEIDHYLYGHPKHNR